MEVVLKQEDWLDDVITMKDLLTAMDCDDILTQKQLSEDCTFIVQCNSCLNLFRSLQVYFEHKKQCGDEEIDDEDVNFGQNATSPTGTHMQLPHSTVTNNQPLLEDLPEPADFPQTQSRYSSQFPFSERIQKSTQDSRGDTVMSASSASSDLRDKIRRDKRNSENTGSQISNREQPNSQSFAVSTELQENDYTQQKLPDDDELVNVVDDPQQFALSERSNLSPGSRLHFNGGYAELVECPNCSELFPSMHEKDQHLKLECPALVQRAESNDKTTVVGAESVNEEQDELNTLVSTLNFSGKRKNRFKCNDCETTFSNRGSLVRHKSVHKINKGKQPYALECSYCHKRYANERTLTRHQKFVHGLHESMGLGASVAKNSLKKPLVDRFKHSRKLAKGRENRKPNVEDSVEQDVNDLLQDLEGSDGEKATHLHKSKTPGDVITNRISDVELSIYVDIETKQCLICLGRYATKTLVLQHIRSVHADNIRAIENNIEPPNEKNVNSQKELIEQFPTEANNILNTSTKRAFKAIETVDLESPCVSDQEFSEDFESSKLTCAICGKRFDLIADFEKHVMLPHKIEIKKR